MCVAGSLHNPVLLKLLFSLMETDKIVAQTVLFRTTETVNKLCLGPGMARMERDCNWKKIGPLLFKFYLKYSKNQPGGGGGEGNKAWDRETMFSQLAKQSARQRFYERPGKFSTVIY